jgi:hypothetical protein
MISSLPQISYANFIGAPSVHINSTFHRANDFPAHPEKLAAPSGPGKVAGDEELKLPRLARDLVRAKSSNQFAQAAYIC